MRKPKDILDKKLYAFFMIYGIKTSDKSIPYIVQAMQEYAKEYHQTELLKLNKSDVISSVCNHTWKLMRNTHYLYRCTKCGIPNEMQTEL